MVYDNMIIEIYYTGAGSALEAQFRGFVKESRNAIIICEADLK